MIRITSYRKHGLEFREFNYDMPPCPYCKESDYNVSLNHTDMKWRCWCTGCSASGPRQDTMKDAVEIVENVYGKLRRL